MTTNDFTALTAITALDAFRVCSGAYSAHRSNTSVPTADVLAPLAEFLALPSVRIDDKKLSEALGSLQASVESYLQYVAQQGQEDGDLNYTVPPACIAEAVVKAHLMLIAFNYFLYTAGNASQPEYKPQYNNMGEHGGFSIHSPYKSQDINDNLQY